MVVSQLMSESISYELRNQDNVPRTLHAMMGEHGMLLAFTDDVWEVSSIRYVLWLQRQTFKLATNGINCALIVPNQSYELNGFFMSIPRKISFPLLADPTCKIYDDLEMEHPGYLLLTPEGDVLRRWYVGETASLSMKSVMYYLNSNK